MSLCTDVFRSGIAPMIHRLRAVANLTQVGIAFRRDVIRKVLCGMMKDDGSARHADAGYPEAIAAAKRMEVKIPMLR